MRLEKSCVYPCVARVFKSRSHQSGFALLKDRIGRRVYVPCCIRACVRVVCVSSGWVSQHGRSNVSVGYRLTAWPGLGYLLLAAMILDCKTASHLQVRSHNIYKASYNV